MSLSKINILTGRGFLSSSLASAFLVENRVWHGSLTKDVGFSSHAESLPYSSPIRLFAKRDDRMKGSRIASRRTSSSRLISRRHSSFVSMTAYVCLYT